MDDKELSGRLVYLTHHYDVWLRQVSPKFEVTMANRLAKVIKVFDWDTDEGKILLEERERTGKWTKLDSKAFKFVLKVYAPDLELKGKKHLTFVEMAPRYYPGTEMQMFSLLPEIMLKDLQKEEKNIFSLQKKHDTERVCDEGKQNPDGVRGAKKVFVRKRPH